jgi:hypothetical protein
MFFQLLRNLSCWRPNYAHYCMARERMHTITDINRIMEGLYMNRYGDVTKMNICSLNLIKGTARIENYCNIRQFVIQRVPLEGSHGKCWFTTTCHTCMKCGCHRRCWKCPLVCSMYTWLVTVVSKNNGPSIRRCDKAQNTPNSGDGGVLLAVHARFHYATNVFFGIYITG